MRTSTAATALLTTALLTVPAGTAQATTGQPGTVRITAVVPVVPYALHSTDGQGGQSDSGTVRLQYQCWPGEDTRYGVDIGVTLRAGDLYALDERMLTNLPCSGQRETVRIQISRRTSLPFTPSRPYDLGTLDVHHGPTWGELSTTTRRVLVLYRGW
ncbi:hypothetical protein [Kineococcus glutinatus]|uniref:Uncharacterized protein n=1 Tax=Kineococcus glutinatus TaxID=1070872 RepID=A0ABP9HAR3_9ACTN